MLQVENVDGETTSTGKWRLPEVPHKGWSCVDVEDLGEPSAVCEMCETQEIRYVHTMEHPDYPGQLRVGCICSGAMEEDYVQARGRERAMRNVAARKRKWLLRRWKCSTAGNLYIKASGYHIVVFKRVEGWLYRITELSSDTQRKSLKFFDTQDAARLRAFDAMLWMQQTAKERPMVVDEDSLTLE